MNTQISISRVIVALLCAVTAACGGSSPTAPTATIAAPQSTGVSPATGVRGTSVAVTLTGTQFVTGVTTAVAVSGTGIAVSNVNVQSATTASATLTIAPDAALGPRTVSVTNTAGTGQGLTFTVLPPPPTLETIDPPLVQAGASAVMTLKGTNFITAGTAVAISGTALTVSDLSVVDATTLSITVNAGQAAELGGRMVTVTTAGGTTAEQPIFVAPPPLVITSVTGARLRLGETTTIRISGSGFIPGVTTVVSSNPAVQVVAVRIMSAPSTPGRVRAAAVSFSAIGTFIEADLAVRFGGAFSNFESLIRGTIAHVNLVIENALDPLLEAFPVGAERIARIKDLLAGIGIGVGPGGPDAELVVDIAPPLPLIGAFEAVPAAVTQGQSSTLKWRGIEHATSCVIVGFGDVPCADGSIIVSPATTTEYRLLAVGAGGDEVRASTGVFVEVPAPVTSTPPASTPSSSTTFSTVGVAESFTVPAGVTQVTLEVSGGSGGTGAGSTPSNSGAAGGLGGRVTATVAVTPGETLTVMVGGLGSNAVNGGAFGFGGGAGGVGDGANSGSTGLGGGGGGGASSVRRGSTVLAIAGGGGGGGGNFGATSGGTGGGGGGAGMAGSGQAAGTTGGGLGATLSAAGTGGGGAGGDGSDGVNRNGGEGGAAANASSGAGGGGGGGAFGGGGGGGGSQFSGTGQAGGGGGGGSSTTDSGATSVTHQRGVQSGNGLVVIRW